MKIEGKNAVLEALKSGVTINKILVDKNYASRKDEILNLASKNKIKVEFLPKTKLDAVSQVKNHQGYIAEAIEFKYCEIADILAYAYSKKEDPFVVILDGIEDPHNLGAIIRTCECAGVHGIIIPKDRACPVNDTAVKTSAGAVANVKIARVTNIKDSISKLKDAGLWIFALDASGENMTKKDLCGPIALVVGNEGFGVKKTVQSACDDTISITMKGKTNSLNASVATAVGIYEVVRQRDEHTSK